MLTKTGRTARGAPGRAIGGSGWTLKSLAFRKFTLTAQLVDEDGAEQSLTTQDP